MTGTLKKTSGFTLIELIVVVGVLGTVSIVATAFLLTTLSTSGKSEALKQSRQSGEYALNVVKGLITSSKNVVSPCFESLPDPLPEEIVFISQDGGQVTINCLSDASGSFIASNSSRLTSEAVNVSNCIFACIQKPGTPAIVQVSYRLEPVNTENLRPNEQTTLEFNTSVTTNNF